MTQLSFPQRTEDEAEYENPYKLIEADDGDELRMKIPLPYKLPDSLLNLLTPPSTSSNDDAPQFKTNPQLSLLLPM